MGNEPLPAFLEGTRQLLGWLGRQALVLAAFAGLLFLASSLPAAALPLLPWLGVPAGLLLGTAAALLGWHAAWADRSGERERRHWVAFGRQASGTVLASAAAVEATALAVAHPLLVRMSGEPDLVGGGMLLLVTVLLTGLVGFVGVLAACGPDAAGEPERHPNATATRG